MSSLLPFRSKSGECRFPTRGGAGTGFTCVINCFSAGLRAGRPWSTRTSGRYGPSKIWFREFWRVFFVHFGDGCYVENIRGCAGKARMFARKKCAIRHLICAEKPRICLICARENRAYEPWNYVGVQISAHMEMSVTRKKQNRNFTKSHLKIGEIIFSAFPSGFEEISYI